MSTGAIGGPRSAGVRPFTASTARKLLAVARAPCRRGGLQSPSSLSGSAGMPGDASSNSSSGQDVSRPAADAAASGSPKESLWAKVKDWFTGAKDKEKLASIGMAAFLSYSCVSNATYGFCLTVAWVTFVKQKGITPLEPGQWAPFLAFYAGLWTLQNIIRPLRFGFSIAIAPLFDRLLNSMAAKLNKDKKVAFTICLGLMAATMTTCMFSSIYLLGGLPNGLGPFPPLRRF